jgi:hypothetical protein
MGSDLFLAVFLIEYETHPRKYQGSQMLFILSKKFEVFTHRCSLPFEPRFASNTANAPRSPGLTFALQSKNFI